MAKNTINSRGFTLVETAIVLVIGGFILTMLFNSLNIYLKNTKISTTRERIKIIDEQIQVYLNDQGHLPCPARLGQIGMLAPTYGVETNCNNPAIANQTFPLDGNNIRLGMVPTRTLNLPDDFGYDAWGNRIVYAVTRNLARSDALYSPNGGAIDIIDTQGNSVTGLASTTHYVVFSPGANQLGAYSSNGNQIKACGANNATQDQENCDNDGRFRNTVLTADAGGAQDFDDIMVSRSMSDFDKDVPPQAVLLFRLDVCPQGWVNSNVPASPPANHRYCRKNN